MRLITNHTYNKGLGLYIGEPYNPDCKENKSILITQVCTGKFINSKTEFYKRNYKSHKKGDPKQVEILEPIYDTILDAWKAVDEYPTVSYGLTNWQRNVLIVDIDEYYNSLEEAINKFECVKPTYYIRNPKTGHIQFGFVLSISFRKKAKYFNFEWYNKVNRILSNTFKSDTRFNGPACKNPYYFEFESKVFEERIYTFKEIKENIEKSFGWNEDIEKTSNDTSSSYLYNTKKYDTNHITHYMNILRNKIFKYFRENYKQLTDDFTILKFEQETIEQMIQEGYVFNNMNQTKDATIKILDWCNTKGWNQFGKYNNIITAGEERNTFGLNSRRKSIEVRRNKKNEKIRKFREWMELNENRLHKSKSRIIEEGKITQKQAAEEIGISYQEFKKYWSMSKKGEISWSNSKDNLSSLLYNTKKYDTEYPIENIDFNNNINNSDNKILVA